MEDKETKDSKNLEKWKIINFDYASLYTHLRKISIRKIWKREFTNTL